MTSWTTELFIVIYKNYFDTLYRNTWKYTVFSTLLQYSLFTNFCAVESFYLKLLIILSNSHYGIYQQVLKLLFCLAKFKSISSKHSFLFAFFSSICKFKKCKKWYGVGLFTMNLFCLKIIASVNFVAEIC